MKIFDNIRNFFILLEEKDFKKYALIFFVLIFTILGFIFYRYFSKVSHLKKEIQRTNIAREDAKQLLTKHQKVKRQKILVDEILEKDKKFKILQFFDSVVEKLNLSNKVSDKKISQNDLENSADQDYIEIKLDVTLSGMNMKQVNDLLNEIENNERVYIKSLEITRPNSVPAVDVNITIVTLQFKAGITESE